MGWKPLVLAACMAGHGVADAATFSFTADPFAGSTALSTPGRQVVGGEAFVAFDPAADVFAFDLAVFGMTPPLVLVNGAIGAVPASGANFIVLQTFDNDAEPSTPFNAGSAANLIAAQVQSPGAGFFIYFNSGLDLPRLVYSTDLDDPTSDLRILARLTNLTGAAGRDALDDIGTANVAAIPARSVPEAPTGLLLLAGAAALLAGGAIRQWTERGARRRAPVAASQPTKRTVNSPNPP
jgi:hypothetical protein